MKSYERFKDNLKDLDEIVINDTNTLELEDTDDPHY